MANAGSTGRIGLTTEKDNLDNVLSFVFFSNGIFGFTVINGNSVLNKETATDCNFLIYLTIEIATKIVLFVLLGKGSCIPEIISFISSAYETENIEQNIVININAIKNFFIIILLPPLPGYFYKEIFNYF